MYDYDKFLNDINSLNKGEIIKTDNIIVSKIN